VETHYEYTKQVLWPETRYCRKKLSTTVAQAQELAAWQRKGLNWPFSKQKMGQRFQNRPENYFRESIR
jgi:YHS domain-containing protein